MESATPAGDASSRANVPTSERLGVDEGRTDLDAAALDAVAGGTTGTTKPPFQFGGAGGFAGGGSGDSF